MLLSRRRTIQILGAGVVFGLSGCLSSQEVRPEEHVEDWHDEPVQGSRQPISVEQTVEVPPVLSDQCGLRAADAVEKQVLTRTNSPPSLRVDYTKTTALPDAGWVVIVYREMIIGPNGEVRETPEISFKTVHKATPSVVNVTVSDGDQEHSCRYAVYVADTYYQMD